MWVQYEENSGKSEIFIINFLEPLKRNLELAAFLMLYGKNKSEGKMVAEKVKLTQIMSERMR